jgi:hypothetical protein
MTLSLLLDNSQLVLILDATSYMQNIILRERKYRECRLMERGNVQDHVNAHKLLVQDLQAVGVTVPEDRQVMELILSLPPSFDSIVNSLQLVKDGLSLKLLVDLGGPAPT